MGWDLTFNIEVGVIVIPFSENFFLKCCFHIFVPPYNSTNANKQDNLCLILFTLHLSLSQKDSFHNLIFVLTKNMVDVF